ncbi:13152_t:CDS:2 [Acaulospora morrowiae]|uniref:13152_t:CDS:1 n=1 Tax=Acaulospora morrowiae TaxID=94023 RepID=A0A9N9I9U1_9GLOM|nr:13152_t:CDS:2 [Acaulospora morrowiae]
MNEDIHRIILEILFEDFLSLEFNYTNLKLVNKNFSKIVDEIIYSKILKFASGSYEKDRLLHLEFLPSDDFIISPNHNHIWTKPAYIQEDIMKLDEKHEKIPIPIASDRFILFHSKIIHDFYNSKAERQKELLMKIKYDVTLYWIPSGKEYYRINNENYNYNVYKSKYYNFNILKADIYNELMDKIINIDSREIDEKYRFLYLYIQRDLNRMYIRLKLGTQFSLYHTLSIHFSYSFCV